MKNAETVGKIFDVMDIFLGGVGLVTLTLGAIGIVNIMLVAVSERTREIGLRKALGATNRSILLQFFLEGAFLTLMSGAIGMGGAALLMHAMSGMGQGAWFRSSDHVVHVGDGGYWNAGACRNLCRTLSRAQSFDVAAGRRPEAGVAMVKDLLVQAYGAMRHNRRRTALTMLGMAWGIATVVLAAGLRCRIRPRHRDHLRQLGHAHHRRLPRPHLAAGGRAKGRHQDQVHLRRHRPHCERRAAGDIALPRWWGRM